MVRDSTSVDIALKKYQSGENIKKSSCLSHSYASIDSTDLKYVLICDRYWCGSK